MTAPFRASRQSTVTICLWVIAVGVCLSVAHVAAQTPAGATVDREVVESDDVPYGQCTGDACDEDSDLPVVALLLPVSGRHAGLGDRVRQIVTAAMSGVEGVRVLVFDTAGTIAGVDKAVASAVSHNARVLAGGIGDRESAALAAAAAKVRLPLITMGRSDLASDGVIQAVVSRRRLAESLLDAVAGIAQPDCALVIRRGDAFGDAEFNAFKAALDARNIKLAGSRVLPGAGGDETAFASEVAGFMKQYRETRKCRNELMYLILDVNESRRLVEHLRFAGHFETGDGSVTLAGTRLFDDPGLAAQAGTSLLGMVFVDLDVDEVSQGGRVDIFSLEVEDFASIVSFAATAIAGSTGSGQWSPAARITIPGRTGTLVIENGHVTGQRIRACRITSRGIEYLE